MSTGKIAVPGVDVPGSDSVSIEIGDSLVIQFVEDCCFCCDETEVDFFVPQLPVGDHKKGHLWCGVAQQSGTVEFHHTKYGSSCEDATEHKKQKDQASSRSIQIGT